MRHFSMRPAALMYQAFCFPEGDWGALNDLHMAAMMGNLADCTRLVDAVKDINAVDARGCSVIHHAALSENVEVMLLLLERGADVHARTATAATALHIGAFNGRVAICKLLLLRGIDVHAEDVDGHTAVYDARFMMGSACPCAADTPESQNGRVAAFLERVMALDAAAARDFVQRSWGYFVSEILQDALSCTRRLSHLLACYRADVNSRDYDGSTVLHAAAQSGKVDAARILLEHDAAVTCCTNLGETPLHMAAREGHEVLVELLVEHGADVQAASRTGRKPRDETRLWNTTSDSARVVAALEAEGPRAREQQAGSREACVGEKRRISCTMQEDSVR